MQANMRDVDLTRPAVPASPSMRGGVAAAVAIYKQAQGRCRGGWFRSVHLP